MFLFGAFVCLGKFEEVELSFVIVVDVFLGFSVAELVCTVVDVLVFGGEELGLLVGGKVDTAIMIKENPSIKLKNGSNSFFLWHK